MSNKQARFLVNNGMTRQSGTKAQINLRDQVKNPVLFPKYTDRKKPSGIERELFPTPCAQDYKHRGPNSRQQGLSDVVRSWPTPTARDYKDGSKSSRANVPVNGLLGRAVQVDNPPNDGGKSGSNKEFFLTPRASDTGKGEKQDTFLKRMGDRTNVCFHSLPAQVGGQLNAVWVEALMGYPQDWTDIEKNCPFENLYPKAWLTGEWERGIPRVITGQKNRPRRIKALGNSIVPQIPFALFLSIEFDRWR
jgi:hypothetical protein